MPLRLLLIAFLLAAVAGHAEAPAVSALLLSDIHFDPFTDPAKLPQLAAAPAAQWAAILSHPSVDQADRFAALKTACHTRGDDTSAALLAASLHAMRSHEPDPQIITVSGDLMAHAFDCKFRASFPKGTDAQYRAFAVKTIEFVHLQLRQLYPHAALYMALGNNDSDCGDYKLDPHGEFLAQVARIFAQDRPQAERDRIARDIAAGGYYDASLPFPHTRLVAIDDLLMTRKASTCSGGSPRAANDEEIHWLKEKLDQARLRGDHVILMGHIPPGVNLHALVSKGKGLCDTGSPATFLDSDDLSQALVKNHDVLRLALFGHTHMDEIHLLGSEPSAAIAMKLVPSISPIDGNTPAFTTAQFNSAGTLLNYQVYVASNSTPQAEWKLSYDFDATYHIREFTPASVGALLAQFSSDRRSEKQESQAYIHNFMPGAPLPFLSLVWPQYVCTARFADPDQARSCACQ